MHRQAAMIGGGVDPSEPLGLGGARRPLPHPDRALLLVETVAPCRRRLAHRRADAAALLTRQATALGTRGRRCHLGSERWEGPSVGSLVTPLPANPADPAAREHASLDRAWGSPPLCQDHVRQLESQLFTAEGVIGDPGARVSGGVWRGDAGRRPGTSCLVLVGSAIGWGA